MNKSVSIMNAVVAERVLQNEAMKLAIGNENYALWIQKIQEF